MPTRVLITGANSGIGKEVARQFAERAAFDTVYLACRNPAKAEAARAELEQVTGRAIFTTVPIDTSDLQSVRAAIDLIEAPLQTVVLNAGGTGDSTRMALTRDGVTTTFASNVLGHAVLLEELIAADALTGSAVLVGSEAARGVPRLGMKRPTFATHTVDEFASVMDGSFFADRKAVPALTYSQVKYLGALYISELARRNPRLRILTVSPGNTAGTEVFAFLPAVVRPVWDRVLMGRVFPKIGLAHSLSTGSRRIVDSALSDELRSGRFYASTAKVLTGPLIDQAEVYSDFGSPEFQANAYEAVHRFLDAR
jgi:NAD(P)-dependent dehydrogenase (short-subunit alcohol dehydrogenase family)